MSRTPRLVFLKEEVMVGREWGGSEGGLGTECGIHA